MKLVHLSDLHLGKKVNGFSMLEDQRYILKEILQIIDREKPDAVIVAGDVYDKSVPPAEAVTLFDEFLYWLSLFETPLFIISGNHDSAERLAFGSRLVEDKGIHLSQVYRSGIGPVTLEDEYGSVDVFMLPFVKPSTVRAGMPEEAGDERDAVKSYTDAVRAAVDDMKVNAGRRCVLVTHQFVTGASTCESEEISVGGTDNVDASVFEPFDYVALGHLHGPQNVGSQRIRYCGTPLKYSFSEARQEKSVTIAELGPDGELEIRTEALVPMREMREVRGAYTEVTDKRNWDTGGREDYIKVTLTDEDDIPDALAKLRYFYPNIMKLEYDNLRTRSNAQIGAAEAVESKSPVELFSEFFELQNNRPMSEEQREIASGIIEKIWEEQQ